MTGIDGIIDALLDVEPAPVPPIVARTAPVVDASAADAYRRAETVDELVLDSRVAVLRRTPTGGQVHVLDGIGPTIWSAAAGGSTLAQLVDAVVSAHGEPADGDPRDDRADGRAGAHRRRDPAAADSALRGAADRAVTQT